MAADPSARQIYQLFLQITPLMPDYYLNNKSEKVQR